MRVILRIRPIHPGRKGKLDHFLASLDPSWFLLGFVLSILAGVLACSYFGLNVD